MLNFLCVGAQKAGTSWLYRHLNLTNNVFFPKGKEVHYWDWVERGKRRKNHGYYKALFEQHTDMLSGDMTPCYGLLKSESIREIQIIYPDVKIIYIFRNPIDRAWSAFKMGMSVMRMKPHEVSHQGMMDVLKSASSIQRSDHYTVLKNWNSVFSSDQILVLDFDDLIADNRSFLRKVFNFLDLDTSYIDTKSDGELSARVNKGITMTIPNSIHAELLSIYEPKIIQFQDYLEKDLSHWLSSR